jgi:hypothetical protein
MPRLTLITPSILLSACAALACASKSAVPTCASSSDCTASARCIGQACVENTPPVASVALPSGQLAANALLAFDGSGSSDLDPDDSVTSWAWTFRAVSAPCDAPTVAGTGPTAQVRFACPGGYEVDLAVEDELSAVSPVVTVPFDVAAHDGPALVEAGPDVVVAHACLGTPLVCAPTSAIALSASTQGAIGAIGVVVFEWTVTPPPGRELDSTRHVAFVPDGFSPSPALTIETDGTAISGDWLLEVEARDDAGVLGSAVTRVSIGNGPPVMVETVPTPDHVFEGTQLSASGDIGISVSDPDGDPIPVREALWHHTGDGAASIFTGSDLGTLITFDIVVPYASPADAALLIGGAGLERSVELAVEDVNGALTREVWPIAVGNRPPVLVSSPSSFSVDHSYDAADAAYEAVASLSTWSDPDGDPLFQTGTTGDTACASIAVTAGQAVASCSLPFAGSAAAANFAGSHIVTQRIGDFWAEGPATAVTFGIGNRAPTITSTAAVTPGGCSYSSSCCLTSGGECIYFSATAGPYTVTVPSRFADPDGDPIDVQVGSAGTVTPVQPLVCSPSDCALVLDIAATHVCGTRTTTLPLTVTDGAAAVSGTLDVHWDCS